MNAESSEFKETRFGEGITKDLYLRAQSYGGLENNTYSFMFTFNLINLKNYNPTFDVVDSELMVDATGQVYNFYDFKEEIDIKIGYADQIKQVTKDLEDLVIILPHIEDDIEGDPIIMKLIPEKNWIYLIESAIIPEK